MMIVSDRLAEYQQQDGQWQNKPLVIVPDLVVEVVSPNDTFSEMSMKVRRYLQDGVRLVWVLDLLTREVTVYQSGVRQTEILVETDTLTGGEVLPGFAVLVSALFPQIIAE
jgi:Uma2 family endonuclease